MKNIFLLIALFTLSISTVFGQVPTTNEKEVKITLDSKYYNSASSVIIGFFKQAKITNYFIDESLEKNSTLNFRFKQKTVNETIELLSKVYSVDFQTNEKKDFYFVFLKVKK